MKQYMIDFTGVKTVYNLHEAIKNGLNLSSDYGMNMDALWDSITGGTIEYPATIYLMGLNTLPRGLNEKRNLMIEVFNEVIDYYDDGRFKFKTIDS